ncbi:MAG: ATP-binding protein [Chloroherpetonaceae bacterium]|nr:ATP-binding protein [Chloroherpetonaceae bacterium]MCS7212107.1 ATP-binding protein [Chloroherpetonaceae bacterium]MDW8020872.1 ATP-binding protein [Chloroherpetonaceae bacterium]
MRREVAILQDSISDLAREAVLMLSDPTGAYQINFSLETFTEKELRDFFKTAIADLCSDLAEESTDKLKKYLVRASDFLSELRIDERLRLLLAMKKVLLQKLASLTIYTTPTAIRISQIIDDCILEVAYHYEIELMKSETSDMLVADEIADELYRTRKKLEKQKHFITSLIENSPDAITLLDSRRRVTLWNKAATELLGYKQVQIVGKSLDKITVAEGDLRSILRESEKKGKLFGAELTLKTQDDRLLPVSISVSTIDTTSEKEPHFVVVIRDASELRQMRDQVIDAERLSAMAKIAGAVAHEVRNPLNSLSLNLDLLEDELDLHASPKIQKQLLILREEIAKLNDIVSNYLSLSRLNKTDFVLTNIRNLIDVCIDKAEANFLLMKKPVKFKRLYSDSLQLFAMIDERQFSRVLVNLFQNALEACSENTVCEIEVAIGQENSLAVIEVRDNGDGLSDDALEKLFTPFYSTKSGGTGLGLYIVREIVEAHHGDIEIKNRTDRHGAVARVTLPLVEKPVLEPIS